MDGTLSHIFAQHVIRQDFFHELILGFLVFCLEERGEDSSVFDYRDSRF